MSPVQVSQDIANLFGASSSSSLVSLLWHLKRCATWKVQLVDAQFMSASVMASHRNCSFARV